MPAKNQHITRTNELNEIRRFLNQPGPGFTFLRGRRRVGKTWLLKDVQQSTPNCFYFMGLEDATDARIRRAFAESWYEFSKESNLMEISSEYLTWARIFKEVLAYAKKNLSTQLVILLDEIQWIAKKNSGFISELKQAWVDWQRNGEIKVIVCGSSNKFFAKQTTGSNDILRGIKTSASIWVNELTLGEIERYYLSSWSRSEICLTYMMLGGSPYYLETIAPEKGFIHALNDAIFTSDSIFLDEVNQVLKLEFNSVGLTTAKKILSCLGQNGATFSMILKESKIPASTLSSAISNLLEYEILFERQEFSDLNRATNSSPRFYLRDFFLNYYFQILDKFSNIIRSNKNQLIFTSKALLANSSFYIADFSGKAFELLCERLLLRREFKIPLKDKLMIKSLDYEVGSYRAGNSQVDLIVQDRSDRLARIIECKWIDNNHKFSDHLKQAIRLKYQAPENFSVKRYLLTSYAVSKAQHQQARDNKIEILGLDDLFDKPI